MSEKVNYLASDFKMKHTSTLKRYLFSFQQKRGDAVDSVPQSSLSPCNLLLCPIWLFWEHKWIYKNSFLSSSWDWKVHLRLFMIATIENIPQAKLT